MYKGTHTSTYRMKYETHVIYKHNELQININSINSHIEILNINDRASCCNTFHYYNRQTVLSLYILLKPSFHYRIYVHIVFFTQPILIAFSKISLPFKKKIAYDPSISVYVSLTAFQKSQ